MADQSFHLDGQQLAKICKHTLPGPDDELLLSTLQSLNPDYPIRLAKTGEEWYRLGGIVDMAGNRIATRPLPDVAAAFAALLNGRARQLRAA